MENRSRRGFSLVELLVVISIIAILVSLLGPVLTQTKARAKQMQCGHQLRQLGIGFHGFAHDHNSQFPMSVPMEGGGSQEFAENGRRVAGEFYFGYRHFQALSNDLSSTKVFVCPADTRKAALSFALLDNRALSYFVAVTASLDQPASILAGDRNVAADGRNSGSTVRMGLVPLQWNAELHHFRGNVLFSDGHVEAKHTPVQGLAFTEAVLPSTNSGTRTIVARYQPAFAPRPAPSRPVSVPPSPPQQQWSVPPARNARFINSAFGQSQVERNTPSRPESLNRPAPRTTNLQPAPALLAQAESAASSQPAGPTETWNSKWLLLLALLLLFLLASIAFVVRAWMQYNSRIEHRPWRKARA